MGYSLLWFNAPALCGLTLLLVLVIVLFAELVLLSFFSGCLNYPRQFICILYTAYTTSLLEDARRYPD